MKDDKQKLQQGDRPNQKQERKNRGPLSDQQHSPPNSNQMNKDKPPSGQQRISLSERPLFNAEVARSPFSKYGFSGITIYNPNRHETTTNLYCFQLSPKGIAKISSLRSKFQIICGSIWTETSKDDPRIAIHPLFKYLIQKTMAYDYLFDVKQTEYNTRIADELRDYQDGAQRRDLIAEYVKRLKDYFHQQNDKQKQVYESERKNKLKRIQKLKAFCQNMALLRNKSEECFISILRSRFQSGKFSFYSFTTDQMHAFQWPDIVRIAKKLATYVDAIEPLKKHQQQIRLRLFQKHHKTYFKTILIEPTEPHDQMNINISKYSQEPEAILHTIEDHVFLRKKNQKENLGVSVQMVKDICAALKGYEKTVTKDMQNKKYYDFVSPQNIIFDQFSLHPKLKYEPVLQEALGLRNKPFSLENLITFCPTPENFNYFRSLQEFDDETKLILNDPFFGNILLHGDDKRKLSKEDGEDIEAERVHLLKIKENLLVWKFLLTSYYIINGREFGKDNRLVKETDIQTNFKAELTRAKQSLSKKQSSLQQFLGVVRQQSKEFNFTFEELMEYLRLDIKDDIFQNFRYARLKIYHTLRNILLKEIIKIFICDTILVKMYNVKKYMCIFSILVNQLLGEAETLQTCENAKSGERRNVRLTLDRDMKLKNGKTYYEYLCTTYEKIINYQKRDKNRDLQARYLTVDPEGVKHFQQIKYMKKYMDKLMEWANQLKKHEDKLKSKEEQLPLRMKDQYEKQDDTIYLRTLSELRQSLQLQTPKIRLFLCKLMLQQLNVSQPSDLKYHKVSNITPMVEQSLIFFNKKLITLVSSLLLFDKNQLCNFESLVIPMLRVDDSEKRYEIKIFDSEKEIKQENENVMFIRELLLVQGGGEERTIAEMKQLVRDLLCEQKMVKQSQSNEIHLCRPKSDIGSTQDVIFDKFDSINHKSHQSKMASQSESSMLDQRNRNHKK